MSLFFSFVVNRYTIGVPTYGCAGVELESRQRERYIAFKYMTNPLDTLYRVPPSCYTGTTKEKKAMTNTNQYNNTCQCGNTINSPCHDVCVHCAHAGVYECDSCGRGMQTDSEY